MTVSEFIEWLKTQDQGATVEILVGESGTGYGGDFYHRASLDIEKHSDYTDFRGNQFAVGKSYENERRLFLGSD
jgi:hypothetical protein